MEIPGYKYIAHKIIPRPWGVELRFTVNDGTNPDYNDIVMLPDEKADEKEMARLITERMALTKEMEANKPPPPEKIYLESEVKAIMVEKGYLTVAEKIDDLKPLSALTSATKAG